MATIEEARKALRGKTELFEVLERVEQAYDGTHCQVALQGKRASYGLVIGSEHVQPDSDPGERSYRQKQAEIFTRHLDAAIAEFKQFLRERLGIEEDTAEGDSASQQEAADEEEEPVTDCPDSTDSESA